MPSSAWIVELMSWTPDCAPDFTIFVAGELHRLASELRANVRLYFGAGCSYLKLIETHASRPQCAGLVSHRRRRYHPPLTAWRRHIPAGIAVDTDCS